jgi:hypothetical protein
MLSAAGQCAMALAIAAQAAAAQPPPPRAAPFDCSWVYRPAVSPRERFEGVYFSFIDDSGFVPCATRSACAAWIGREKVEIRFSERASDQMRRRSAGIYGIYRIVFEGRRGKIGTRPGCGTDGWSLDPRSDDYLQVEELVAVAAVDR